MKSVKHNIRSLMAEVDYSLYDYSYKIAVNTYGKIQYYTVFKDLVKSSLRELKHHA